uniref:Uncharacterized protein n=1 Tax=Avena sativa TaxID=4498 RepID=A0ACD5UE79_AVESA
MLTMATDSAVSREVGVGQQKPLRDYTPSPWGKFFLNHIPCTPSQYKEMEDMARAKKEVVRKTILDVAASPDLATKLELVDTLQRIGVGYHYREEIGELLHDVHDDEDAKECDDLGVAALRFYLLRKQGYHVSPDVFLKFRDGHGNYESNDVKSLLTLYDAAHTRVHGEQILDDAIAFTRTRLRSIAEQGNLEPPLAEEVRCTLETSCFRRVERVEARRYISVYEKKATRDKTILELAKVDFNIIQTIYCQELKALTIWWEDFKSRTGLQFARDRIVEMHFWMLGVLYEPQHSCSRVMITKLVMFVSLCDDLFDNYSTTEESNMFTAAMDRWEKQAAEKFPAYLKAIYVNILDTTDGIVEELKRQKNKYAELVRKLVINMVKCYHAEVKWRDEHYVPATVEEHLEVSVRSSACMHIISLTFITFGDITTMEAIEWASTYPKIVRGVCIVGRIGNDMVSNEREQGSEHVSSTVETCMKEHGITTEQAHVKLKAIIEEAWMDITMEYLEHKHPILLLEKAIDLARTMDFMYKHEDAYTLSYSLKSTLESLFVNFV